MIGDIWYNTNDVLPEKKKWVRAIVSYDRDNEEIVICWLGKFHWHYEYSSISFINGNITHWQSYKRVG